ncbi:MAG: inorganic phosphate transporter [Bacteroidia bacterium]|nr:inorganic phosphate transporter [Bacteroidia bacterium]
MIYQLFIAFLIAYFLGMNMGGSGIGPSFSAAFGADVIRKSLIFGLFGIMVLLGALIAGNQTAYTKLFFFFFPTWFILPVTAFILCLFVGKFIYLPIRKTGITISKKFNNNKWLRLIIICCCCYVAFSLGANNVANASGPLLTMTSNELGVNNENKLLLLLMMNVFIIAPSFGLGSSIFGNKVIQNTGKEIVLFGKLEAAIIAFITASLLLCVSLVKGIPTSLVQLNVASILGIGVAKLGFKNIFKKTEVQKFFLMWLIAPVIAFTLSLLLTVLFNRMNWLD